LGDGIPQSDKAPWPGGPRRAEAAVIIIDEKIGPNQGIEIGQLVERQLQAPKSHRVVPVLAPGLTTDHVPFYLTPFRAVVGRTTADVIHLLLFALA